jgi:hypothetical protein
LFKRKNKKSAKEMASDFWIIGKFPGVKFVEIGEGTAI